ncbi:MAG: 50S ribosomal protein L5 [Candidatus Hydrogenedentota bacterium]|nr:MAG: 50S ribosomal protein L5 [Candidatus Hydrogenedentota bacterium]
MAARLLEKYKSEIVSDLRDKYKYENVMQVPRLDKIVVNMGVGEANTDARVLEVAIGELATLSGQKPSARQARKSISNFKIREGQKIGCMVTLRGTRMYEFMDRLFNVAMPRIRDFRGVSDKAFDNSHNYNLGLKEQTMFPEINMDNVSAARGMNVTFVFRNMNTREESLDLLRMFGMPFQKRDN